MLQTEMKKVLLLSTNTFKKIQMLCCSALTVPMGWYLFWLSNGIFVSHNSILEGNMTNLFGFFICVALILVSFKFDSISILLSPRVRVKKPQISHQTNTAVKVETRDGSKPKPGYNRRIDQSTQQSKAFQRTNQRKNEPQIGENAQFEDPVQMPSVKSQSLAGNECDHFAFLQQGVKSMEIPDQCLTCKKLLDCASKTKSAD